jgi:hypothetical protein
MHIVRELQNAINMNKMTYQQENDIHVRPAELGDICLLLEPAGEEGIVQLQQYQRSLQANFGGTPIERIHLTCQRFATQDKLKLKNFEKGLERIAAGMKPLPLTAVSLQTLYLPIRQTNILKWQIDLTDELRQFVSAIEQALVEVKIKPLYRTGFVSSLLTALKEVPVVAEDKLDEYGGFPHHLYSGERIVLSQICGPNEFETLASMPFHLTNESMG